MKTTIEWNQDATQAYTHCDLLVLAKGLENSLFITTATCCDPKKNVWVSGEYQLSGVIAWANTYAEVDDE